MKVKETEAQLKKSIHDLQAIISQCISFFETNTEFAEEVHAKYNISKELISQIERKARDALASMKNLTEQSGKAFFLNIKKMLLDGWHDCDDTFNLCE